MNDRRSILKSLLVAPLTLFSKFKYTNQKKVEFMMAFIWNNEMVSIALDKDYRVVDMQKTEGVHAIKFYVPVAVDPERGTAELGMSQYGKDGKVKNGKSTSAFPWRSEQPMATYKL